MPQKTTKPTKSTSPKTSSRPTARRLRPTKHHWWRRVPKNARPKLQPLPSAWYILKRTFAVLWNHKKLFAGIMLFYGLFALVLVQSSSAVDVQSLKTALTDAFKGNGGQLAASISIIGYLASSPAAGAYQLILLLIVGLASVWALRQVTAGHKIKIREAYYKGMTPLVPLVLMILMLSIRLIPFAIGSTIYDVVSSYGVAAGSAEQILWLVVYILLTAWSIYLILPTIMGLFVVTLPEMTPRQALRSAKQMVYRRRWNLIRKLLVLLLTVVLIMGAVMVPVIAYLAPAASWIFFVLSWFLIAFIVTYGYVLYLELLNHAQNV